MRTTHWLLLALAALLVAVVAVHLAATDGPGGVPLSTQPGEVSSAGAPHLRGFPASRRGAPAQGPAAVDARGGCLTGLVQTSDGATVNGATVEVRREAESGGSAGRLEGELLARSGTNSLGRFRVTLAERGPVEVGVSAPGYANSVQSCVQAGQDLLVLMYECASLEVIARGPIGEPVTSAQVDVRVATIGGGSCRSFKITNESGSATFDDLPRSGRCLLVGWHEDYGEVVRSFDLQTAHATPLTLRFKRGRELRGFVLDGQTGVGVADARLRLQSGRRTLGATDASGCFVLRGWLPPPPPHGALVVMARGYTPTSVLPRLDADNTIRLQPARTSLYGTVLTYDGSPASGAEVEVRYSDHPGGKALRVALVRCDVSGNFTAALADDQRYELRVRRRASGTLWVEVQVPAEVGSEYPVGPFKLPAATGLAGQVLDGQQVPVAAGRVILRHSSAGSGLSRTREPEYRTTDATGRFSYEDLAPGTYVLHAYTPDGTLRRLWDVTVLEGTTTELRFLLVAPGSRRVLVRVLSPQGTPVAGVRICVRSREGHGRWLTDERGEALIAVAEDTRWFELTGSVLTEAGWTAPATRLPSGAATVEVRLLERRDVRGLVVADITGEPLPMVELQLMTPSGKILGQTVTDLLGGFSFVLRQEGAGALDLALTGHRVDCGAGEQLRSPSRWLGSTTVTLPPSERVVLRARAGDRVAVEFQVQDPAGDAAPYAIVVLRPRDIGAVWTGRCDESGRWRCEGLMPGVAFMATARPPDRAARDLGWWTSSMVECDADQTPAVTLRLEQALQLRGSVQMRAGSTQGMVVVRITGRGGERFGPVRAEADGAFSVWLPKHALPVTLYAQGEDGSVIGSTRVDEVQGPGTEVSIHSD